MGGEPDVAVVKLDSGSWGRYPRQSEQLAVSKVYRGRVDSK